MRFCDESSYFGLANELPVDDDRLPDLEKQFLETGVDETYSWSADYAIAKFIHKVLVSYRKDVGGWPGGLASQEEWYEILDEMIEGFSFYISDNLSKHDELASAKIDKSLKLFERWFTALWT